MRLHMDTAQAMRADAQRPEPMVLLTVRFKDGEQVVMDRVDQAQLRIQDRAGRLLAQWDEPTEVLEDGRQVLRSELDAEAADLSGDTLRAQLQVLTGTGIWLTTNLQIQVSG